MTRHVKTLIGDNIKWAEPLKSGEIAPSACSLDFEPAREASPHFKRFVREQAFDCGELAIVTYLQALDYGKPLVLLPVVVLGGFHHKSIAYNLARGKITPSSLAGKVIGVKTYAQTTGVWVRGILEHDYGAHLDEVTWVTFEDAHLAEYRDPPNCKRAPEGGRIVDMVLEGAFDGAILGLNMPQDPRVRPVITDHEAAASAWRARHGTPINHMLVVSRQLCDADPAAVRSIYRAFHEAREKTPSDLPLGLDADWSALDLVSQYAFEQGVTAKKYSSRELLADANRLLGDSI